ncbi:hypothetical protein U8527_07485 [Kordia algicida OT-1]|nr:hypothetical protein [Kordia algicida]
MQLIFLVSSFYATACSCDPPSITEKYVQSDFVANVTIVKIYPNEKNKELYRADIKINKLYKGDQLKSIYVAGNNGGIGSSCSIFIPAKTKLIAYARKNADGKYTIGMCSGLLYIDYSGSYRKKTRKNARQMKNQRRELTILELFKKKNIQYTSKIQFREKAVLHKKLAQFKGLSLKKSYAFFELTFTEHLAVKDVKLIAGFDDPIDNQLIDILKEGSWSSFSNGVKDKVPENSTLLFGIYYYEAENEYASFLSRFYH